MHFHSGQTWCLATSLRLSLETASRLSTCFAAKERKSVLSVWCGLLCMPFFPLSLFVFMFLDVLSLGSTGMVYVESPFFPSLCLCRTWSVFTSLFFGWSAHEPHDHVETSSSLTGNSVIATQVLKFKVGTCISKYQTRFPLSLRPFDDLQEQNIGLKCTGKTSNLLTDAPGNDSLPPCRPTLCFYQAKERCAPAHDSLPNRHGRLLPTSPCLSPQPLTLPLESLPYPMLLRLVCFDASTSSKRHPNPQPHPPRCSAPPPPPNSNPSRRCSPK